MNSTTTSTNRPVAPSGTGSVAFGVLTGLATLAILLQGLWAGIFLRVDGQRGAADGWVQAHATGGEVAIGLTAIALVVAFVTMRSRRDLLIGTGALLVLLVTESYIGGLIVDSGKDTLTAVHVPLAMGIMGLAVWIPLRARAARRAD